MISEQSLQLHDDLTIQMTKRLVDAVGPILSIAEPGSTSVLAAQGAAALAYLVPPTMGRDVTKPETVARVKASIMAMIGADFDKSVAECLEQLSKMEV